ncbi:hypothetical protein KCU90_g145, partial [Aureobasidium melanogenum]
MGTRKLVSSRSNFDAFFSLSQDCACLFVRHDNFCGRVGWYCQGESELTSIDGPLATQHAVRRIMFDLRMSWLERTDASNDLMQPIDDRAKSIVVEACHLSRVDAAVW